MYKKNMDMDLAAITFSSAGSAKVSRGKIETEDLPILMEELGDGERQCVSESDCENEGGWQNLEEGRRDRRCTTET